MTSSSEMIRVLVLPNKGHPYGDHLQQELRRCNVDTLAFNAGWGFDLRQHVDAICALKPDILHLQWPESLYQLPGGDSPDSVAHDIGQALRAFRDAGISIVWTLHNLKPHIPSHPEFQTKVYAHYAANASGVIHHSECGKAQAIGTYTFSRDVRHGIQRHGYFASDTVSLLTQRAARTQLGFENDAKIYLFCGAFRKDKHLDVMINAIGSDQMDERLIMVGQEKADAASIYPDLMLDHANIDWPGRLTFEALGVHVKAADALITAHGDTHLTSAGPHLSQTYLKPQICLRTPYHEEVLGESAFYYDGGEHAVANLRTCLEGVTSERLMQIPAELGAGRAEYQWARIARSTKAFYEEVLNVT